MAESEHAQVHDHRERYRSLSAEYAVAGECLNDGLGRINELVRDTAAATHSLSRDEPPMDCRSSTGRNWQSMQPLCLGSERMGVHVASVLTTTEQLCSKLDARERDPRGSRARLVVLDAKLGRDGLARVEIS